MKKFNGAFLAAGAAIFLGCGSVSQSKGDAGGGGGGGNGMGGTGGGAAQWDVNQWDVARWAQ